MVTIPPSNWWLLVSLASDATEVVVVDTGDA